MGNAYSNYNNENEITPNIAETPLLSIKIDNNKFSIGDEVMGEIVIQPMKNYSITSLTLKVASQEGWFIPNTFFFEDSSLEDEVLSQTINLSSICLVQNGVATLAPHKLVIPFNFSIDSNFIPSFHYPRQSQTAYLYHLLTVEMTSVVGEKWTSTQPITIIALYPQPSAPQIQESTSEVLLMSLFSQGANKISASFSRTVYKYSDNIQFEVTIDNTTCNATANQIEYVLMRKMVFKVSGKEKFKSNKELNRQSKIVQVSQGEKKMYPCVIQFKNNDSKEFEKTNKDISLPECGDLNELVTSVGTSLIYCEYFINIYIGYTGMTRNSNKPRIIMPIFTGRLKMNNINNEVYEDINEIKNEGNMVPPADYDKL